MISKPPDWANILKSDSVRWNAAVDAAAGGPRILIANAYGIEPTVANVDSLLAVALTLRGAEVHLLVCDEALPACVISQIDTLSAAEFVDVGPSRRWCSTCFSGANKIFQSLGLRIHRYGELLTQEDRQEARDLSSNLSVTELKKYRLGALSVGEHALAGALRFYGRGDLEGEPLVEAVLRRYFNAALLSVFAIQRLMASSKFNCVSTLHGIYVPEGLIVEVAREQNVRVAAWYFAYRKRTFTFSHHDTYHRTFVSEPTTAWENLTWTPEMEREILDYLNSRRYGTRDWIRYIEHPQEDLARIAAEIGVDFSKPCVGLLTNVAWDAQVHFHGNAFPNMVEWVLETIRYFADRPDLQLIVRVHPAELLGGIRARQTIVKEITSSFSTLPKNVFIVPPESTISTYILASQCNAALIYGTKTGIELAAMGIPVIVAGEAWVRNKGVTLDAKSPREYFEILNRLPLKERLQEDVTQRARKYAYHFFFRRMIPLPFTYPAPDSIPELDVHGIDDLVPGRNVGLDVICNGILSGSDFIYPAELHSITREKDFQVSKEDRAQGSLQVVGMLGKLGEIERMRAHLLKTVEESPCMVREPWAQFSIARNMRVLALASDKPIAALVALCDEMRVVAGRIGFREQLRIRQSIANILREISIAFWKAGSRWLAAQVAGYSLLYDPTQLVQPDLFTRFMRVSIAGLRKPFTTATASSTE